MPKPAAVAPPISAAAIAAIAAGLVVAIVGAGALYYRHHRASKLGQGERGLEHQARSGAVKVDPNPNN